MFGGASLSVATGCRVTIDKQGRLSGLHHLVVAASDIDIEGWIEATGAVFLRGSSSLEVASGGRIDAPSGDVIMEAKSGSIKGRVTFKDRLCVEAGYLLVDTVKAPVGAPLNGSGALVLRSAGALSVATTALVSGPVQLRAAGALKLAEGMSVDGASDLLVEGANVAIHGSLKATGQVKVQAAWSLQFAPKASIRQAKSVSLMSKGAAQISGQILDVAQVTINAAGALYMSPGAALQSAGPVSLVSGGDVGLHALVKTKGKLYLTAQSLSAGKAASIVGAAEVELLIGGTAETSWAGSLQGGGDVFFKGAKLHLVESGTVVSNKNVTFMAADSLQLDGTISNNGAVFMSAKQFSVGASADFSGNASCVIAGEQVAGSVPLKGCQHAL